MLSQPGHALLEQVVPCNGCRRCCINDAVRILPHEDHRQWKTEPHERLKGARMLAHKPNGECIYLGECGCTIHPRRPQQCRDMDCRNIARAYTYTQARRTPGLPMGVWRRGKELLRLGDNSAE